MTFTRILRRRRATSTGEEGFALIYSLLIILVVTGLATAVLGLIVNQARPNQLARKRQQTLDNAEAGLQAVVNRLRASTSSGTNGNIAALPQCTGSNTYATVTGSVNGASNNYSATIYYLASDPAGMSLSQVQSAAIACNPLNTVPNFAYIQSKGSSPAIPAAPGASPNPQTGNRTLHATYQFQTTNTNVLGGRIQQSTQNMCWTVASMPPAANTPVLLQTCQPSGNAAQSWIYEPNLTIQWTGSTTSTLCVSTKLGSNNYTNQPIVLANCSGAPTPPAVGSQPAGLPVPYGTATNPNTGSSNGSVNATGYVSSLQPAEENQEWGFNDNGHFAGANDTGGLQGYCIGTTVDQSTNTPPAGTALAYVPCYGGVAPTSGQAFNPDASAGAGASTGVTTGYPGPNGQLVNYQEFGRCYDLTGQNPLAGYDIDYPCKQAPDPSNVAFNQRFVFTAASGGNYGTMSTSQNNYDSNGNYVSTTYYCMQQNGFNNSGVSNSVNFQKCNGTGLSTAVGSGDATTSQLWTFTGNLAGDYFDSFEIRTQAGSPVQTYCLSIASPGNGGADGTYSTQILETCNGSNREKWNAPAGGSRSNLLGLSEDVDH